VVTELNKKSVYFSLFLLAIFCFKSSAQQLPKGFVYIQDIIPSIKLEMRYTGNNNFIGKPVDGYFKSKGIVSKKTVKALKKVQRALNKQNLGLKIYDAYRPQKAVNHFIRWAKNLNDTLKKQEFYPNVKKENLFKEEYIAYRSGHSRGSTVDITIVDLSTPKNKELDMGSTYDYFGQKSWVSYTKLTNKQLSNRKLLQEIMLKYGFKNYSKEWWHFTLKNEPFPTTYFNFNID
jgi:zinc D-Ala-D-Ala dipeptidase